MRCTQSPLCGVLLALICCLCQVSAIPGLFRRHASKLEADTPSKTELELLDLDPTDQVAIFGDRGEKCKESLYQSSSSHASLLTPTALSTSSDHISPQADKGQACYARIYDQVKAGCVRDSDMSPDERMLGKLDSTPSSPSLHVVINTDTLSIDAASVLLTLCDLRASNQSVPLECAAAHHATDQRSLGSCVECVTTAGQMIDTYICS